MAISSISQITLPNGSTYALKDAGLHAQTGVLSGDGTHVIGVSENYFRPTVKIFDATPTRIDLSVIKLSAEDYYDLVSSDALLSNAIYVVEGRYYQKSETSSATQISVAIDSIRNMISSAMTSTYEYAQHEIGEQ